MTTPEELGMIRPNGTDLVKEGDNAISQNALVVAEIYDELEPQFQPLKDRLTVGNNDPSSLINRTAGHLHANRLNGTVWVVEGIDSVLSWVKLQKTIYRGNARLAVQKDPDKWADASYNGIWDLPNTSSLDGAVADGYTPPAYRAHAIEHYTSTTGVSYQRAYSYAPDRLFFRASMVPGAEMTGWSENKKLTVESDMVSIYAVGESTTRGGDNGVDWPLGDAYPAKLAAALGAHVSVENAGKGGAFIDEILMRAGRKRLLVRIPAGSIPASGATPANLSWTPETDGPRWIDVPGKINNQSVIVGMNGTTGAWSVRRVLTGAVVPVSGWTEFLPDAKNLEGGVHILWIGGNDATRQVKGPHSSVVAHIIAGIQAYKQSLPAENHSLIVLGMHPSLPPAGNYLERLRDTGEVNAWLEMNMPNEYVSVFDYMRGRAMADLGLTPTAEDQDLIAAGYPPRSLLADNVHPTKAFAAALATQLLAPHILNRGLVRRD